jgi:hypothetical protein
LPPDISNLEKELHVIIHIASNFDTLKQLLGNRKSDTVLLIPFGQKDPQVAAHLRLDVALDAVPIFAFYTFEDLCEIIRSIVKRIK